FSPIVHDGTVDHEISLLELCDIGRFPEYHPSAICLAVGPCPHKIEVAVPEQLHQGLKVDREQLVIVVEMGEVVALRRIQRVVQGIRASDRPLFLRAAIQSPGQSLVRDPRVVERIDDEFGIPAGADATPSKETSAMAAPPGRGSQSVLRSPVGVSSPGATQNSITLSRIVRRAVVSAAPSMPSVPMKYHPRATVRGRWRNTYTLATISGRPKLWMSIPETGARHPTIAPNANV